MIIYSDDDKLITTKLEVSSGCGIRDLCYLAESFRGRETRFFKIIEEYTVSRSIKCLTQRSRFNEAKKIFYEVTGVADSYECYDNENNIGFKLFPFMKNPTIYAYEMIYPAIYEFLQYWRNYNNLDNSNQIFYNPYDLTSLFVCMKNFKELEKIFEISEKQTLKDTLYKEFPEFAIFCYEIYPYIKLNITSEYQISKLIKTRLQVKKLGVDIKDLDLIVDSIEIAHNNAKVLRLINKQH